MSGNFKGDWVKLWIAQGFGAGRIPFAPGTFGSLVGILWFGILLVGRHWWVFVAGSLLAICLSVWLCGAAEKILRQKDPGSIVLDEIAAVPLCFVAWLVLLAGRTGTVLRLEDFFSGRRWLCSLGIFAAFRFFDAVKPWPVRQSQVLPGGWGVTIDDVLAAVYVNIVVLAVYFGRMLFAK